MFSLNIPTLLTLIRIALIPVFVLAYYLPVSWANIATAAIFVLAGATDWFDGYLARRLNQTSAFGAFLDPVADKLMVAVALVLREWMAELGQRAHVAVSFLGKYKTTAQIVALILLLYHQPLFGLDTPLIGFVLLYAAAALTLWSMLVYLRAAWVVLRGQEGTGAG